jgi:hypothetical protein
MDCTSIRDTRVAVLHWVVAGFALWTVCCHVTVATQGTGVQLLWTAAIAFTLVAGGLGWRARRVRAQGSEPPPGAMPAVPAPADQAAACSISSVGLLGALAVIEIWSANKDPFYFWTNALAFLVVSSALLLYRPVALEPAERAHRHEQLGLWALALLAAAVSASLRQPNSDDVVYVNIAATFADHPELTLYAGDPLHDAGVPLLSAYSAHSYELLAGALSWLTGIPALHIMHLGFAPAAGALCVLALAKLFRLLEPRRWLWLVAIVVSWYVFDGTNERSVAGHGFLRIFQGKAVLLSVGVPLIAACAIDFALAPSWRSWGLLASAVIAGMGLSSTGLWLALLVGLTGLFVPLTFRRRYWLALGWGLTSLIYPIAFALFMRQQVISDGRSTAWEIPKTLAAAAAEANGLRPELNSFGTPRLAYAYLACLLLAWPLARSALARRYLVAFSLGGFAVLLNPFLLGLVATNLTGTAVYSRVLWYMPFAASFAIMFAIALPASPGKLRTALGAVITIALLGYFYTTYPKRSNLPLLAAPALKVDPRAYQVSRFVTRALHDDRARVLAPTDVALVLPMLQHSPYLVVSKPRFFEDGPLRYRLMRTVERKGGALRGRYRYAFLAQLAYYRARAVVIHPDAVPTDGMDGSLSIGGFRPAGTIAGYVLWIRPAWTDREALEFEAGTRL